MTAPLDLVRLRRLAEEQRPDFVGPEPPQQYLAFQAAFRPTVVLQLIERLERAEGAIRSLLGDLLEDLKPSAAAEQLLAIVAKARRTFEDSRATHERLHRAEVLLGDVLAEPFEFTVSIGLETRIRDHLAGKP